MSMFSRLVRVDFEPSREVGTLMDQAAVLVDFLIHPKTGFYSNPTKQQYEAWVFSQSTGQGTLIATLTYELACEVEILCWWKHRTWHHLMMEAGRDFEKTLGPQKEG